MKQQTIYSAPSISKENQKKINVQRWIIVKSKRDKNKPAYPPVIMPHEHHGYIKPKRFDFL